MTPASQGFPHAQKLKPDKIKL